MAIDHETRQILHLHRWVLPPDQRDGYFVSIAVARICGKHASLPALEAAGLAWFWRRTQNTRTYKIKKCDVTSEAEEGAIDVGT